MSKRSENFWDVVFYVLMWLGVIILFAWIFLKAFGVINSPLWIDVSPYFGGALAILSITYYLGKIKQGIDYTARKVDITYNKLLGIEQKFNTLSHEHEIAMGRIKIKRH